MLRFETNAVKQTSAGQESVSPAATLVRVSGDTVFFLER